MTSYSLVVDAVLAGQGRETAADSQLLVASGNDDHSAEAPIGGGKHHPCSRAFRPRS